MTEAEQQAQEMTEIQGLTKANLRQWLDLKETRQVMAYLQEQQQAVSETLLKGPGLMEASQAGAYWGNLAGVAAGMDYTLALPNWLLQAPCNEGGE